MWHCYTAAGVRETPLLQVAPARVIWAEAQPQAKTGRRGYTLLSGASSRLRREARGYTLLSGASSRLQAKTGRRGYTLLSGASSDSRSCRLISSAVRGVLSGDGRGTADSTATCWPPELTAIC